MEAETAGFVASTSEVIIHGHWEFALAQTT